MGLLEKIEEQLAIGFTGRINILNEKNSQFIGATLIREGEIVKCHYRKRTKEQALLHLIVADVTSKEDFQFVIEPEIVSKEKGIEAINFVAIKKKASGIVQKFSAIKTLRPPPHLKLLVNPEFISEGSQVTTEEFRVVCAMTEYPNVKDIYEALNLHEYETIEALVSLRKKKAIYVSNENQHTGGTNR